MLVPVLVSSTVLFQLDFFHSDLNPNEKTVYSCCQKVCIPICRLDLLTDTVLLSILQVTTYAVSVTPLQYPADRLLLLLVRLENDREGRQLRF